MFPARVCAISIDITLEEQRCHLPDAANTSSSPSSLPQDLLWVRPSALRLPSYFLLTALPRHCRHSCWRGSLIHGLKDGRCFIIYFRGRGRDGWQHCFYSVRPLTHKLASLFFPFRLTLFFFSLPFSFLPSSRFKINIISRIRHRL